MRLVYTYASIVTDMKISEDVLLEIADMLVEKFGEPIHKQVPTVGIKDEGPGNKSTYADDPEEENWEEPEVVREALNILENESRELELVSALLQQNEPSKGDMQTLERWLRNDNKTEAANLLRTCILSRMKDCKKVLMHVKELLEGLDEVTPPGKEKVVKALKKQKGVKNPYAVAWSQYNKEHGKK